MQKQTIEPLLDAEIDAVGGGYAPWWWPPGWRPPLMNPGEGNNDGMGDAPF